MKKWLALLLIAFLVVPLSAGCGQKQEAKSKAAVIKPIEAPAEEEESDTEETAAPASPAVVAPAASVPAAAAPAVSAPPGPVAASETQPSETLVVADFNSGEKPSNLGGNFGSWNRDPSDPTQFCKEAFDNVTRHGESGFAMKLNYCVDSPNPAYNGFWLMLPNLDATKYDTLSMWIKGDAQAGYTTVLKLELKNSAKQVGRYYISNITDQWQKISVPLSDFKGLVDKTGLTELVIVFEDRMATNKKGTVYIDDISLSKK